MKKILAAVLAAVTVFSVTGCNRGADTVNSNRSTTSSQTHISDENSSGSSTAFTANSSLYSEDTSTTSFSAESSKPESSTVVSSSSSSEPQEVSSSATSEQTSTTQSIPQVHEHKYSEQRFEPTCEAKGYIRFNCSCGDVYTEYYSDALGHEFTQNVIAPTCTAAGYTQHICLRCDYQYTSDEVGAKDHHWGEWTLTAEPTTASEGEEVSVCSDCGEKQRRSVPKLEGASAFVSAVVGLVNAERAKEGLSPLTESERLDEYAQLRSSELVDNFAHKRPNGSSPLDYVMGLDGIHRAGENIAMGYGSPEAVMEGWMNSTGHRENILKPEFTMIGVGCYEYNGRFYWTQIFAG